MGTEHAGESPCSTRLARRDQRSLLSASRPHAGPIPLPAVDSTWRGRTDLLEKLRHRWDTSFHPITALPGAIRKSRSMPLQVACPTGSWRTRIGCISWPSRAFMSAGVYRTSFQFDPTRGQNGHFGMEGPGHLAIVWRRLRSMGRYSQCDHSTPGHD